MIDATHPLSTNLAPPLHLAIRPHQSMQQQQQPEPRCCFTSITIDQLPSSQDLSHNPAPVKEGERGEELAGGHVRTPPEIPVAATFIVRCRAVWHRRM